MLLCIVFINIEFNAGWSRGGRRCFFDGIMLADKNLEDYKILILVWQLV